MSQRRTSASGLFFALLALVTQLAFGATVPNVEATQISALVAVANATTICHAHEPSDQTPSAPHNPADCAICPLCGSLSVPALAIAFGPVLPRPRITVAAPAVILPPATAPPAIRVQAHKPRAPPAFLT
jgi:hypothetical protein